ncbi:MAG: hypothetical protein ACI97N_000339 [Cognaticolwellia sp.]|jgi:hypothetical protein
MKNLFVILGLICFTITLSAQPSVKKFYNKYKHGEEVTSVKVQGWMIKSVLAFTEDFEGEELAKKVTKLRVLVIENGNPVSKKDFIELIADAKSDKFEDLMTIREGSTNIRFMIKENSEKIKNLLVLVYEADEFILISLECNLFWDDLQKIDFREINGGEYIEKLPVKFEKVPRA